MRARVNGLPGLNTPREKCFVGENERGDEGLVIGDYVSYCTCMARI